MPYCRLLHLAGIAHGIVEHFPYRHSIVCLVLPFHSEYGVQGISACLPDRIPVSLNSYLPAILIRKADNRFPWQLSRLPAFSTCFPPNSDPLNRSQNGPDSPEIFLLPNLFLSSYKYTFSLNLVGKSKRCITLYRLYYRHIPSKKQFLRIPNIKNGINGWYSRMSK